MDVEKVIREYISGVIHLSLATCVDNEPWVCEVHFVYDDDLNLYFRSKPSRRHSKDIAANANVAGNIVVQHGLEEKVRGVYFEGCAELLENVDAGHPAYQLYCSRFNTDQSIIDEAKEPDGHKFYKITVREFSLFDSKESNPSRKYTLPWRR